MGNYLLMKKVVRFLLKMLLTLFICSILWVLFYRWFPVPATPLMYIRKTQSGKIQETQHQWVAIEDMSAALQLAVICSEDQGFMTHNGFDTKAIEKAINDHKSGKRLRGASTISQQTAKNAFLWPSRSWIRKGLEVYFTFLIETFWSKKRILEVYLNSIEMGNGIYGAEAAAKFWFNTTAKNLSVDEAAAIAAILPNPRMYMADPPIDYVRKRKIWIIEQMRNYGELQLLE